MLQIVHTTSELKVGQGYARHDLIVQCWGSKDDEYNTILSHSVEGVEEEYDTILSCSTAGRLEREDV